LVQRKLEGEKCGYLKEEAWSITETIGVVRERHVNEAAREGGGKGNSNRGS